MTRTIILLIIGIAIGAVVAQNNEPKVQVDPTVPPTRVLTKMLKVAFVANTYSSSDATDEQLLNSKQYHIVITDASNVIGSCYAHLQSLDEFSDAVSI